MAPTYFTAAIKTQHTGGFDRSQNHLSKNMICRKDELSKGQFIEKTVYWIDNLSKNMSGLKDNFLKTDWS